MSNSTKLYIDGKAVALPPVQPQAVPKQPQVKEPKKLGERPGRQLSYARLSR